MRESTLAATIVADMLQYLALRGVPVDRTTRECGLEIQLPPLPDVRVRGSHMERLWEFAVRETGDPLVGLRMSQEYTSGTLDILGYVVLSCSTIGEVLDRTSRYIRVINDGMRVDVQRSPDLTYVRCAFSVSMDNYLLRRPREAMDTLWGGLARELGRLAHTPLTPTEVWFTHSAPPKSELPEYARVFGERVQFDAPENRFVMPTTHLDVPVRSANPGLLQVFEKHAEEVVAKLDAHRGPSQRVLAIVAARMKGTVPTLDEVAQELSMSDRNLQRALSGDGTTFQKLVDELRRDLALSHLKNPATSAGQVGFLLGFSEPSAFHRAFKRWTGKAPSEYRRVQMQS